MYLVASDLAHFVFDDEEDYRPENGGDNFPRLNQPRAQHSGFAALYCAAIVFTTGERLAIVGYTMVYFTFSQ